MIAVGSCAAFGGLALALLHPDLDRDGLLSRDEYQRFLAGVERRRQSADQGGRGYPPALRFDEIDSDRDGSLNENEMTTALNRRLQRHKRHRGGRW